MTYQIVDKMFERIDKQKFRLGNQVFDIAFANTF